MKAYFAFIGPVLMGVGAYLFAWRLSTRLYGRIAPGRVVGHESRSDEGTIHFLPVVEFTDAQGVVHSFTSVAGASYESPAVGERVHVYYLPDDPTVAYIDSFLHMWAAPLAFAVLGGAAIVAWWRP